MVSLLQRRERDLSSELAARLRRYIGRLQQAVNVREPDATQAPDDFLPEAGDELGGETPEDGDEGGGASGFDDELGGETPHARGW